MIRIIITGAAGRMGRRLVANIAASKDLVLAGATEWEGSEFLGVDAGELAGVGTLGVKLTKDLAPLLENADAIIDFSTGNVMENAAMCAKAGLAIVIGTTGLTMEEREELKKLSATARIIQTTNYSVGVNLLFHLARKTALTLSEDFDIEIIEAHHNKKKDAPSGTALSLAEVLTEARNLSMEEDLRHGRVGMVGARTNKEIGMHSVRGGDIVGDHTVMFAAEGERMELIHRASSRDTFAKGALRAVRYLVTVENGFYDMQDVLGLK